MRNSKKGFIKQYISSVLVTIMVLGIILPNISLNVQAAHNPAGPITVTAGNSPRVDFTHKHKGKGTYYTNKKVTRSQTSVNGYSQSGGCYTNKVQHEHYGDTTSGGECYDATPVYKVHTHGDSCKVYADRYTMKDPSSGYATWDATQTGSYTCPVCGVTHSGIYGYYLASYGNYRRYTPVANRDQWIQLGFQNGVDGSNHQVGTGSGDGWKDIWMYYDKKDDTYVYVTSGGKYYSCAYSNKIDGGNASGTYWTGTYSCSYGSGTSKTVTTTEIDHYNYSLKSDCGYWRDPLYKLNCGMSEGDIYAQSWCGANDNNYLSYEVTKPASVPSNVSYSIHVKMSRPDGTEITSARTYYDNWTTQEVKKGYQITELGEYLVYIHIITKIGGMNVDDDEVTYYYDAVPKGTTIKLIRNWYADDNTVLDTWTNVKRGQEPMTCTVPTREGYDFLRYTKVRGNYTQDQIYYDANGFLKNDPWCPLNGNNGSNMYLYAQWQPKGYTVTYETNNKDLETLITDSQVQVFDYGADNLTTPAKTYSGYTFLGWYANADGTADGDVQWYDVDGTCVKYPSGTSWDISHDVYVYAKYRVDNYTLYYNNNKEDSVEKNSEVIPYDSDYELPDKTHADYEGYTFKGWFDSVLGKVFGTDGANTDSGKWKYTQDVKAKATYEANIYTVNYYAENTAEETKTDKSKDFVYDSAKPKIDAQKVYDGWTSDGYYNGTEKIFNADGTFAKGSKWNIANDITVTPKFTPKKYALNYNLNKEDPVTKISKQIEFNSTYGLTAEDKANRQNYTGYTFKGWYDGTTQIFDVDGNNTDTGVWRRLTNVNAKATYEANSYTVTYYVENPVEETKVNHTDTFVYDQTTGLKLSTAVKSYSGWVLEGFYNGTTKVFNADGTYVGNKWDIAQNITVTPKWTPNEYTLTYTLDKEGTLNNSQTIKFNDTYGLTDADKTNRKSYKGYTFDGWFTADGNLFFNPDGSNTDSGKWRYLNDVTATAQYTANSYKVFYNTEESGSPTKVLNVTYDASYSLPATEVANVPMIPGYTFDGWYLSTDTSVKVFNTNGSSVKALYDYDSDITVLVKYHKNKYIIHYNNTDIDDTDLDKTQEVTFDSSYLDITQAPYKTGYVFDGHTIVVGGTQTFIWDGKGDKTHAIWDFVLGTDGTEVSAYKNYSPKVFDIDIGNDFDNDEIIDSIEETKNATYDAAYFDLSIPATIDGYTFDGYYLINPTGTSQFIATYDAATNTLTKESNTWVYDDGINWVNDPHNHLTLVRKWHKNIYTVNYNNTTVEDTNLDKAEIVTFAMPYSDIAVSPYKAGYLFDGHQIGSDYIWDKEGKATHTTWDFVVGNDTDSVNAYKHYTPKTFTVNIGRDFDNDNVLDSIEQTETITYDGNYGSLTFTIPDKIDGYTFDGWYLIEQDKFIVNNKGVKESSNWTYDDGKDWNTETYNNVFNIALKWHKNTYKVNYNDTTVEDTHLDKNQTVVFDTPYRNILVSPYKTGYIFDGHQIGSDYVWDKEGKATHSVWDFAVGDDNRSVNALKHYTAKTFTVNIGPDFDNDGVLDNIEQTETITYDGTYGSLTFDVPAAIDGYTFDGWYLLEQGQYIVDNKGTKKSDTWTYDDGKDWNSETYNNVFNIALKWHRNTYKVRYNDTTVNDDSLNKSKTVVFDTPYTDILVSPYKTGYVFDGHQIGTTYVWDKEGKAVHTVWDFPMGADNNTVDAFKHYTAKTFIVNIGPDFDNDGVLDSIEQTETVTYDGTYGGLTFTVPDTINGYTFDGWYLIEQGKIIVSNEGTKESNTWVYDDGKDWNTEEYNNVFHIALKWHQNTYTVKYNDTTVEDTDKISRTFIFDEPYGAINTQPKKYGYTGIGWYFKDVNGVEQLIWKPDGTPAKSTFTFDLSTDNTVVEVYKKYEPNPHTVTVIIDNDPIPVVPPIDIPVIFDDPWKIPDGEPDKVPEKPGYTFDGWTRTPDPIPGVVPDPDIFVTPDGKPVDPEYHIDEDITLYPTYHKNSYTVRYNNTDTDDKNLNKKQEVVYDEPYHDIAPSPYKSGYIFEGHYLDKPGQLLPNDPNYQIWDKDGKVTKDKYTFIFDDKDKAVLDTHKIYTPKLITVKTGIDYNEDNKIDTTSLLPSGQTYNGEFTMYYDDIVPDDEFPILREPGLTFTGWYLVGNSITGEIPLYTYDETTNTLVKTNNTWIWDDGKDWNKENGEAFTVVGRFSHDPVTVTIKTETDQKVNNEVGKKSDYKWNTKTRTEFYDLSYDNDSVPTKRGYTFTGYIVEPKNNGEEKNIWDKDAKSTKDTFRWLPTTGESDVKVISTFTANTIKGTIPTEKYDPVKDETTPNPTAIDETYDQPYKPLPSIPEKKGYDFDGITDKDGNPIWDEKGKPTQEVWEYIEEDIDKFIIKWKPKTYILVYPDKTEVTVTFDKAVNTNKTDSKSGHTFKGWTFKHNDKTIHAFGSDGKYNGSVWTYDFGKTGTKIPLSPVFDVNTYQITVKPMTEGYEPYTMEVAYGSAYPDVAIPVKKGYVFNGYDLEYNAETGELSKTLWDKDGKAVESSFGYTHNITVLGQYKAKTYYLHLGDKKVIKVTYDELVERGITLDKEGTEDDNYTYTYDFTGWYMKNGTKLFNDEGFPVYTTWTLDLGDDGTHIYLDGQFDENKVEKEKPQPEEEEEEKKEEPSEKPEETSETVEVTPEVKPGKDHTQALKVLKKAAVIGGLTIGAILLIGLLIFLILLILFLLGEISLVYRFDYNKGKKKLDGICKIHKYKKDERQDEVKFYVTLKEKYYRPLLDTKSKLISVRLAPHWVDRHHGKAIRIQCKDIYHDFILRSSRNGKGDIDKGGFIELSLTESFNN